MKKKNTMNTNFIHNNGIVTVSKIADGHLQNKVAAGIYKVKQNPQTGEYFLVLEKDAYAIGKIYGKVQNERARRIVKAFDKADASVGVLLSGIKGTGKTVLLKLVANHVVKKGLPVVAINEAFSGDGFNSFIESLGECMLMFDEFTKVYLRNEQQADLLTLFDGLNSSKRLTILTSNEANRINSYFIDRPGRILYHYDFRNLDEETFKGFLKDNLKATQFKKDIKKAYERAYMFTFDILKTLVKECNDNPDFTFAKIVSPLNITELKSEVFYEFLEVKNVDGTVFTKGEFGVELISPEVREIYMGALLKSDVTRDHYKAHTKALKKDPKVECTDISDYLYFGKSQFEGTKDGIITFKTGKWTLKVKEIVR